MECVHSVCRGDCTLHTGYTGYVLNTQLLRPQSPVQGVLWLWGCVGRGLRIEAVSVGVHMGERGEVGERVLRGGLGGA
jgi:hypothetical protein